MLVNAVVQHAPNDVYKLHFNYYNRTVVYGFAYVLQKFSVDPQHPPDSQQPVPASSSLRLSVVILNDREKA
jgi:hypothetical protein